MKYGLGGVMGALGILLLGWFAKHPAEASPNALRQQDAAGDSGRLGPGHRCRQARLEHDRQLYEDADRQRHGRDPFRND